MLELSEETKRLLNTSQVQHYKQMMLEGLHSSFPLLTDKQLSDAIEWAIDTHHQNHKASLNNNYTKQTIEGDVIDIMQFIDKQKPIVTSYGVLFKRYDESINLLAKMVRSFIDNRNQYKTTMKTYDRGTFLYNKYDLLQKLEKSSVNSIYGLLSHHTSFIYNLYIGEGITRQGRSYLSTSIMLLESLLSNNVKFNSLNEIITFIHNIVNEKPERKFDDSIILLGESRNIRESSIMNDIAVNIANYHPQDREPLYPIDSNGKPRYPIRDELFFRLMTNVDTTLWMPTEKELSLLWDRLCALSTEDINRIYYKNNLYSFCDLPIVTDMIIDILCTLKSPFINANKPLKEIANKLDNLVSLLMEYVYYHHPYIDKLDRVEYMERDTVAIADTDSCIISTYGWYRFILDKVYAIDMPIKRQKRNMITLLDVDEFGDMDKRNMCTIVKPELDYDFYTDTTIKKHKSREMTKLIPQEGLRISIINIIVYLCYNCVVDYLRRYCKLAGSERDGVKCKMSMKNEFYFKRALLTANRKNYAALMGIQEGKPIPQNRNASLQISGLPIGKSTLSDGIKNKLQEILYEDIMKADNIDQIDIMKKLIVIEKQIIDSILNKETTYYRPDNVSAIQNYADPMRQNGVKAIWLYNLLRDDSMPAINPNERNQIYKVKLIINKTNVELIKDTYPDVYDKLINLLNDPETSDKLDTIGFLLDMKIPDWVLEFVDIASIVNDNLQNFPLESIGLKRLNNNAVNYSNIIQL